MRSAESEPQTSAPEPAGVDYTGLTNAVRALVQIMREGGVDQLDISQGDLHIHLSSRPAEHANNAPLYRHAVDTSDEPSVERQASDGAVHETFLISAPMVGTYYEASSPGERPFVVAGDRVEAGQTVAIIEAMKIMNEIVADRPGVVEVVLVQNGETVEYGHPLFRLRPL